MQDFRETGLMRSCDDCPGGTECAGSNLHPVLVKVFDLYDAGTTDKFDILFKLGDEREALIEKYDHRVSEVCWSKAALLAIADVVARTEAEADIATHARATLATARDAFERFPWTLAELIEQAPDLHRAILDQSPEPLDEHLSKRAFVKMCKDIAYHR
jgi:hypothetical protein